MAEVGQSYYPAIHDLIDPTTGRTYKEENLDLVHNIPVGALVEVKYDEWYGDGACEKVHARLWVVQHGRDCDGTPLYSLSRWNDYDFAMSVHAVKGGFSEDALTPIEVTEAISQGDNALEWDDVPSD